MRRFLLARVAEGRMPGAAWWVEEAGHLITSGAVGCAVVEPAREPLTPDTPFDLASLTKPLSTAVLLALLEQEGALDLEAPLSRWLPELDSSPYARISLLALAAHAAGMPAWHPLFIGAQGLSACLAEMARLTPAVAAGQTLYSDLGYVALGAAIERAAGQPLDALFAERIARPLGLRRTGFAREVDRFGDAAATECGSHHERALAGAAGVGFRWRERIPRGEVHDTNAWALGGVCGHAGLFGPACEVARLAGGLLRPSPLELGDRARASVLAPSRPGQGRTVGFVLASHASAARGILPDDAPGHTGFTGTAVWLDPPRARVFVLLTNRIHPRVPSRPFHPVRRGFHRAALSLLRGHPA